MVRFLTVVSSLALTGLFFYLAGPWGLGVAIMVILIFEAMHKAVYGKSISHIADEDYYDHPNNPANILARLRCRSGCPGWSGHRACPVSPREWTEHQQQELLTVEPEDEYR